MFWNGSRWADDTSALPPAPPPSRRRSLQDWLATIPILLLIPALIYPLWTVGASTPSLSVAGLAVRGGQLSVTGDAFPGRTWVQLQWDRLSTGLPTVRTSPQGHFDATVPISMDTPLGAHLLSAVVTRGNIGKYALGAPDGGSGLTLVTATVAVSAAAPTATPAPAVTPSPTATVAPTGTPAPTVAPNLTATVAPTGTPAPTVAPTAAVAPTGTPAPTVAPTAAQNVVRFGPSVTYTQLLAAIADDTIDVIELSPGTYYLYVLQVNADRSRPVVIRPEQPGTVVWKPGNGAWDAIEFGFGGRRAGNITIDGVIFDGYRIGDVGVISIGNAHDITLSHITVRNTTTVTSPSGSWALYLSSSGGVGPSNIVADYWTVDGSNRSIGAVQSMHDPNTRTATMRHWTVQSVAFAIYAASDATNLTFDDWSIGSSGAPHDGGTYSVVIVGVTGVYRNLRTTNSGGPYIYGPIANGGGNSWN